MAVCFGTIIGVVPATLIMCLSSAKIEPWRSIPKILVGATVGWVVCAMPFAFLYGSDLNATLGQIGSVVGPTLGALLALGLWSKAPDRKRDADIDAADGTKSLPSDLDSGFQIEEPRVFVNWRIPESVLTGLFEPGTLKHVADGYYTMSCVSLGGLRHRLGFHFEPRRSGKLAYLEFFQDRYDHIEKVIR